MHLAIIHTSRAGGVTYHSPSWFVLRTDLCSVEHYALGQLCAGCPVVGQSDTYAGAVAQRAAYLGRHLFDEVTP